MLGGSLAALAGTLVGLFLILRKEAMTGHAVGHIAFGGLAVGLLVGIQPLLAAMGVAVLAILAIGYMRGRGVAQSDAALAVMVAVGFSVGLVVIGVAGGFNVDLFAFLFGSVLTIDLLELGLVAGLSVAVLLFVALFYKELLSLTFDEEAARLAGIPAAPLSVTFGVLIGVTIVLTIKVIGVILVGALMVVPGLSALQLNVSFRRTAVATVAFGVVSVVVGILLSALYDVATSGVIVFTAVGFLAFAAAYRRLE